MDYDAEGDISVTPAERQQQIAKYNLVKRKGGYWVLLSGYYVPYRFGRRCPDRMECRECYGCFAGCNCGCSTEGEAQ